MKDLLKNLSKVKKLYDEGKYLQAALLFLKVMAEVGAEFEEDEDGQLVVKARTKLKAADIKNLQKSREILEEMQADVEGENRAMAGGFWLTLIITLLPKLIELVGKLEGQE